jgi:hypothetical protein
MRNEAVNIPLVTSADSNIKYAAVSFWLRPQLTAMYLILLSAELTI